MGNPQEAWSPVAPDPARFLDDGSLDKALNDLGKGTIVKVTKVDGTELVVTGACPSFGDIKHVYFANRKSQIFKRVSTVGVNEY